MGRSHDDASQAGATLAMRRLFDMTSRRKRYQTDAQGKRIAVVLPMADYETLLDDLHDLAVVAERRDETTLYEATLKRRLVEGGSVERSVQGLGREGSPPHPGHAPPPLSRAHRRAVRGTSSSPRRPADRKRAHVSCARGSLSSRLPRR